MCHEFGLSDDQIIGHIAARLDLGMEEATGIMERYMEKQLSIFVEAQAYGEYEEALAEIRNGRKESHWMWYIFPQIAGLGHSEMARRYAISNLSLAKAYLAHPELGQRLLEISRALLELDETDPVSIMGGIDSLKLRSCMTLFHQAAPGEKVFVGVLDKFYGGEQDKLTLDILARQNEEKSCHH